MMNKRVFALICAICLLISGCQLAKPEDPAPTTEPEEDAAIVGILVSFGSDPDGLHTEENKGKRIYAALIPEVHPRPDGTSYTTSQFRFPENSGVSFMAYMVPDGPNGPGGYRTHSADPEFEIPILSFWTVDGGAQTRMEGILYVSQDAADLQLYMNPIYQTPDGEIYALGICPAAVTGGMDGRQVRYDKGDSVQITVRTAPIPEKYVLLQMDSAHHVLERTEYAPGAMPETVAPGTDCAYLILETCGTDGTLERTVCSPGDEITRITTYMPLESGIFRRNVTVIEWEAK